MTPTLDLNRLFKRFGGPPGLHARLSRSPYGAGPLSQATVRAWKTRGALPGAMVLPVLLMLRDEGEDPLSFVTVPALPNPFKGITNALPEQRRTKRGNGPPEGRGADDH